MNLFDYYILIALMNLSDYYILIAFLILYYIGRYR